MRKYAVIEDESGACVGNGRDELKSEPYFAAAVDRLTSSGVKVEIVPQDGGYHFKEQR
ncbi:hypothetical protein ACP26L_16740 [Paenibacillus sp. S-38]|uniref:hypothetical protein n=1 Tax=Paenibacillus sp. S-38 TaxID=3416710 RepID=UPI003CF44B69